MAEMGLGTDSEFAPHGAESGLVPFPALLADVSEPDHSEAVADSADPDLFQCRVCFRAVWRVSDAAPDRIADRAVSGLFRNGDFHSVPVCPAVPFSVFCPLYLCPGGRFLGLSAEKLAKKSR